MFRNILTTLALLLPLAACGNQESAEKATEKATEKTGESAEKTQGQAQLSPEITAADLAQHIKIISSDAYGGRAPSSPGEEKTMAYLKAHFERMGLEPGNGASYFQEVPLVAITPKPDPKLTIKGPNHVLTPKNGTESVMITYRVVDAIDVKASEMVFVGYGIVAPEYGWNDYEGLDVTGKTVVILVNDPGYATQKSDLFKGNTMTYYGRWTYKYEEAMRQGAAGALIVHETAPAAYPWQVVEKGWTGPQFSLRSEDGNKGRLAIEGWLSYETAKAVFNAAGRDYDTDKKAALGPDFKAVPLGLTADMSLENDLRESVSHNAIARLPGAKHPEEVILYMAHWDHLGTDADKEAAGEDGIYNGAFDNASGTAALLEIADRFAAEAAKGSVPDRSLVFVAVTAEEQGLLGSQYYGTHPVYPLAQTVGGINMDGINNIGRVKDISVVGVGSSEMEDYLKEAAAGQNRVVTAEPFPEKGYYYRSDHFNLAKVGVPMLYTDSGFDSVEHGAEWGKAKAKEYTAKNYHQPSDEFDPNWDLSGGVEDAELFFAIGHELANNADWPNWYAGSEFKAIREQSRKP